MSMKFAGVSGIALAAALAFAAAPSAVKANGGSLKDTYEPAPVALWAGCYVGGHVGGAWDDDDDGDDVKFKKYDSYHDWKFDSDDDDTAFIGGVHAGCNWQDRDMVYGVEGDVSFGDSIDYLASLRARGGVAVDGIHFYGTIGVAFLGADDDFSVYFEDYGKRYYYERDSKKHVYSDSDDEVGLVVGLGAEKKVDTNVSVGIEALYYFFGDDDNNEFLLGCAECDKKHPPEKFGRDDDNDVFVVRGRLTFHLDKREEPLPPLK